jgi:hypothetical protein
MTAPDWLKDRHAYHVLQLGVLSRKADDLEVACPRCVGSNQRSTELCCVSGVVSVAEARRFHADELALIAGPGSVIA